LLLLIVGGMLRGEPGLHKAAEGMRDVGYHDLP
jgi:hypothetical protein